MEPPAIATCPTRRPRHSGPTAGSAPATSARSRPGRLRIIDRKKELLTPDHGRNIAPAQIESELKCAYPQIGHVCVVGDRRPHLATLIVLEPPELGNDQHIRTLVGRAIARINADLDPRERIKVHAILTKPWVPGDELTETLKLRRRHILDKHSETIDRLYDD